MPKRGVPAPSLAPRIGQEVVRERAGVSYRELRTRSLVNRCTSPRMPFEWTVNPYRGCAMGCRYCYATYTHEFMGIDAPEAFHSSVFVKTGGEHETARGIARAIRRGERIALGTATDPYQPGEAVWGTTRRFLESVARQRGLRLDITTKGAGILRDVELLKRIHLRSRLRIQVSLISPHAELLRELEPFAPPPEVRLRVMQTLAEAGLDVRLNLAPVLPGLTDAEADVDRLLGEVRRRGVRGVLFLLLFLRSPTRDRYLRFIRERFPRLARAYETAYATSAYLPAAYRRRIGALMERMREKHGLEIRGEEARRFARERGARQLSLAL